MRRPDKSAKDKVTWIAAKAINKTVNILNVFDALNWLNNISFKRSDVKRLTMVKPRQAAYDHFSVLHCVVHCSLKSKFHTIIALLLQSAQASPAVG